MTMLVTRQSLSACDELTLYSDDGSYRTICRNDSVYMTEEIPIDEQDVYAVDVLFNITKANTDEGLVSGWASVAVNADGSLPLDWQDDIIAPETLEKAAINFMKEYRESGVMHQGDSTGIVVESIVLTKEKQESIGIPEGSVPEGWFITVKVLDPEVFAKVKEGTFKMFSIQGSAKRVKL